MAKGDVIKKFKLALKLINLKLRVFNDNGCELQLNGTFVWRCMSFNSSLLRVNVCPLK
jgi:hypothetical protein